MGNYWDVEDGIEGSLYPLQEFAKLIVQLDDKSLERLSEELGGFSESDERIARILEIFDDIGYVDLASGERRLAVCEFDEFSPIMEQPIELAETWLDEASHHVDAPDLGEKEFWLDLGGKVRHSLTTDGVVCTFASVGPGGGTHVQDTEEAMQKVLPHVNERLLSALRDAGFGNLAGEFENRIARTKSGSQ
jgi:hypothetical protein